MAADGRVIADGDRQKTGETDVYNVDPGLWNERDVLRWEPVTTGVSMQESETVTVTFLSASRARTACLT